MENLGMGYAGGGGDGVLHGLRDPQIPLLSPFPVPQFPREDAQPLPGTTATGGCCPGSGTRGPGDGPRRRGHPGVRRGDAGAARQRPSPCPGNNGGGIFDGLGSKSCGIRCEIGVTGGTGSREVTGEGHGGPRRVGLPGTQRDGRAGVSAGTSVAHGGDKEPRSRWAPVPHPGAPGDAGPGWHGQGDPGRGAGRRWGPGAAKAGGEERWRGRGRGTDLLLICFYNFAF